MSNTHYRKAANALGLTFYHEDEQREYFKFAAKTPILHASFNVGMQSKFGLNQEQVNKVRQYIAGESAENSVVSRAMAWLNGEKT